jgi:hypothetical protein
MRTAFRPRAAGALIASLAAFLPSPASAQSELDPTGTPPTVIKLYRSVPKLGHERAAEMAGAGFGIISERFGSPDRWIGGSSISGRAEMLWVEGFPSHAAVEASMAAMRNTPGFAAAGDSVWRSVAAHLDAGDVTWAYHRPDLGYRPGWVTRETWLLQVIRFLVKPGTEGDYEAVLRTFAKAYADAAVDLPWSVYQVSNGAPGPAYLMIIPMASLEKLDLDMRSMGAVASRVPDMSALMAQWARSGSSVEAHLYVLSPALSRLPPGFLAEE